MSESELPPDDLSVKAGESADISIEIPVVLLGEAGESGTGPRLLQGRISESVVLYPCYALVSLSGLIALNFAMESPEWASLPVAVGWFALFNWYWFYGVAYRYRRRVLKYTSVLTLIGFSVALSMICVDRGKAQIAFDGEHIGHRDPETGLYWAAVFVIVALVLLLTHVVFLGRGYRRKRD